MSRPGGRVGRGNPFAEEGPDSIEQGGGQHPPGVTRGTVPQRQTASGPVVTAYDVRGDDGCG